MQKKLSKGITKKRKTAPNKQYGDAPNPTVNKTLKIQYSDQRRIPEEGAEQIEEKEKEAQKEANEGTRRRHNLQSYNIEKIEFPEWKPFDNEDWSLTEPRRMREFSDYGINDPSLPDFDLPELKKILLSLLKFNLRDLNDFVGSFPGLDFPFYFPTGGTVTVEGEETRAVTKVPLWDFGLYENHSPTVTRSVTGNIWSGDFVQETIDTMRFITFELEADAESAIGTEQITVPFELDSAPSFNYSVEKVRAYSQDTGHLLVSLFPPEYEVTPVEWKNSIRRPDGSIETAKFRHLPYWRPIAYPTYITAELQNNVITITERFLFQTSITACNHKRRVTGTIIMGAETPEWMGWETNE